MRPLVRRLLIARHRQMSSTAASSTTGDEFVIVENVHQNFHLKLNRPQALNALTLPMVQSITSRLKQYEQAERGHGLVLMTGNGRAFCAGGDVKAVINAGEKGQIEEATRFFREEYLMNHMIATYSKPIVAFLNGITMGGGVGLSIHAPFRIATENTVFAMPETAIGLFPDVGGSFFLPRLLDGQLGTYLALSGARIKGPEAFWANIATHFVPADRLPALQHRLLNLNISNNEYGVYQMIDKAIEEFSGDVDINQFANFTENRPLIDECFKFDTVEEIMESLRKHQHKSEFAKLTIKTLEKMSPISMKVSLEQLRRGSRLGIADCFQMEYRMVHRAVEGFFSRDFYEGVTAKLVNKPPTDPKWQPAKLSDISTKTVEKYFSTLPNQVQLGSDINYKEYPHQLGLPREIQIKDIVDRKLKKQKTVTVDLVLQEFKERRFSKHGLEQRVRQFLFSRYLVSADDKIQMSKI